MTFRVSFSVQESGKKAPKWSIDGDLDGKLTLKDFEQTIKQVLLNTAIQVLEEEQAKGFDKKPRVRVDNKFNKPIVDVKPFGKIEFFARADASQAILDAYLFVLKRSPVASSLYRNSNYVFRNNKLIATSLSELTTYLKNTPLGEKDVVRIVNVTPYAARLEYAGVRRETRGANKGANLAKRRRGKSKYTPGLVIKKPNGAYVLAERAIRNKYKGAVGFIKFAFMPNGTQGINIRSAPSGGGRSGTSPLRNSYSSKNKRYTGPYVYPSIVFQFAQGGIQ